MRGGRLLHIHDMAEFAAQRPDEPIYRELVENGGYPDSAGSAAA